LQFGVAPFNFQAMPLKTSATNMSSQNLENHVSVAPAPDHVAWSPRSPAERILMALKMHGALSAAALGPMLGTTGEAVRQQLVRLAQDGLVVATSEARGVGRPTQLWNLTAAAQSRFPDTHAALTVQLLDIVKTSLGQDALDTLISIRETETRTGYETALADRHALRDRVAALAGLRSAEGYMAEWREQPDGSLLLIENHCPICAAATACQGFCRAELDVFRAVLGPDIAVERTEHIVAGGRRCTYAISEVRP
jgi:predicted ArsR family transcriptional regulator